MILTRPWCPRIKDTFSYRVSKAQTTNFDGCDSHLMEPAPPPDSCGDYRAPGLGISQVSLNSYLFYLLE